jgi:drug/metabolite transporter (DMT)-like permease
LCSNLVGAAFLLLFCTARHWYTGESFSSLFSLSIFIASLPKNAFMVGSLYLMYLSLPNIALSYAGAIRASGPLWTLAGAWILTGESLTELEIACLAASVIIYFFYAVLGKKEGVNRTQYMPILGMLLATLLSSLVTAYDKYLAVTYGIQSFDAVQVSSAVQRVMFAFAIFILVKGRLSFSRAIIFNGVAWGIAEYCYFYAYSSEDAKATLLAVLRRLSLVTGLIGSAAVFGESHFRIKFILCLALIAVSALMVVK